MFLETAGCGIEIAGFPFVPKTTPRPSDTVRFNAYSVLIKFYVVRIL